MLSKLPLFKADFQQNLLSANSPVIKCAKLIKWINLKKSSLLRRISLPSSFLMCLWGVRILEICAWLELPYLSPSNTLPIKINLRTVKLVLSLPTLTWPVSHRLHKDKTFLFGAKTAASVLAWQKRKIICQNLILKHYECHPESLLLIEM